MTRGNEKTVAPGRATTAETDTELLGKGIVMNESTTLQTTTDRDWRGHVPAVVDIMTAAGFVVKPDDLMMQSLVNGDNSRSVDRSRFYIVNAGVE